MESLEGCIKHLLLMKYRRILDSIHALGNIYYDKGRFEAYKTIAVIASNTRRGL